MPTKDEPQPLDNPLVSEFIFFPRREFTPPPPHATDFRIDVETGVEVSTRLYSTDEARPTIIYFHGNGEVVSDYDYVAPMYAESGLNLWVVDYRGYGASTGRPTIGNALSDAHKVFETAKNLLEERGYSSNLFIMGRSLGSAPACEIAAHYGNDLRGLIIESGFASTVRLLRHLGLDLSLPEGVALPNLSNIQHITIPSLLMHGEMDTLIPLSEAQDIYAHLPTSDKRLFVIPNAGHNDIMYTGGRDYFQAIADFVARHLA